MILEHGLHGFNNRISIRVIRGQVLLLGQWWLGYIAVHR